MMPVLRPLFRCSANLRKIFGCLLLRGTQVGRGDKKCRCSPPVPVRWEDTGEGERRLRGDDSK